MSLMFWFSTKVAQFPVILSRIWGSPVGRVPPSGFCVPKPRVTVIVFRRWSGMFLLASWSLTRDLRA